MEKQKVLITGFPHTGTSILKSKIGECSNVYEYPYESPTVRPEYLQYAKDKKFVLVKYPMLPIEIRANHLLQVSEHSIYKDYKIIFVTRNPWNVFTSVIKSGGNPINNLQPNTQNNDYYFKVEEYIASAQHFLEASNREKYPNFFTIKYEDFFPNNFEKLKNIFKEIGFEFSDEIFKTKSKNYIHWPNVYFKNIDESSLDYKNKRFEYRTWQINQPFQNMNSDVNIPDELDKILKESPIIKKLGYIDPRITNW